MIYKVFGPSSRFCQPFSNVSGWFDQFSTSFDNLRREIFSQRNLSAFSDGLSSRTGIFVTFRISGNNNTAASSNYKLWLFAYRDINQSTNHQPIHKASAPCALGRLATTSNAGPQSGVPELDCTTQNGTPHPASVVFGG